MRAGTRERLTGACDTLIAIAAVLIIVAVHWPWAHATLTPPAPDVMKSPAQASGLYAHASLWAATAIAALQLALLVARYYPGGRLRVPGDGVLLALGSAVAYLIIGWDMLLMPAPWADNYVIGDSATFPWWSRPELLDGTTLVMTMSYGARVAAAAALTSLISAIASPGPPAILPYRHRGSPQEAAAD
jgi:hypothetical protein